MTDRLAALTQAGVSIWLDDLSRDRLPSGSLADLVARDHVAGVTTNPTIFARAIAEGSAYEAQLRDLAARGVAAGEGLRALTTFDVRWACDVLRPVYDATGGVDGRVSIEVDPRLAHDTGATIAEARALWWAVDRPNLFIKIPAARQGLPAIAACLAEAISINVTLIFSLARYDGVMDAFLDGMERARDADPPVPDRLGGLVLRVPGGHRGRRAAGQVGTTGSSGAARPGRPSRTRGWPTSSTSRGFSSPRWTALAGGREPGRSGRCGPPRRSRTRPTLTPAT